MNYEYFFLLCWVPDFVLVVILWWLLWYTSKSKNLTLLISNIIKLGNVPIDELKRSRLRIKRLNYQIIQVVKGDYKIKTEPISDRKQQNTELNSSN